MIVNKLIIHELIKDAGNQNTTVIVSDILLPINTESINLVTRLLKSYQNDMISYAQFDNNPGRYFPEQYFIYNTSERTENQFIDFTKNLIWNLQSIIKTKVLAKGGYIVFTEYELNNINFIAIFLIRDTEGQLLKRTKKSFEIHKIEYLDTNHLAMACRINETRIIEGQTNYLSFIKVKQHNISDYFTDWISIFQLETSIEFTNTLYKIINAIDLPFDYQRNMKYTIDEIRSIVYENAMTNTNRNINLRNLSEQIYGNQSTIINYAEQNNISIDSEFRFNYAALKKFIQISVVKDGISLKFSRGDDGTKVKISEENPNIVIIESVKFASALKEQLYNE